ncbi:hypothetical protein C7974DRAFT_376939 [Boeremia exigua]|uniref:uncharacterized protein n=1 Tax=Boeremia exigua TaxID=749465 RepID=UPI001E8DF411|nr:uncharacterized protein C7974DRAFT_376939 [Boeremia exigua]KAH6625421.1 hypothetical protein C7974DRAFT_376939 [Boeremia exigua]
MARDERLLARSCADRCAAAVHSLCHSLRGAASWRPWIASLPRRRPKQLLPRAASVWQLWHPSPSRPSLGQGQQGRAGKRSSSFVEQPARSLLEQPGLRTPQHALHHVDGVCLAATSSHSQRPAAWAVLTAAPWRSPISIGRRVSRPTSARSQPRTAALPSKYKPPIFAKPVLRCLRSALCGCWPSSTAASVFKTLNSCTRLAAESALRRAARLDRPSTVAVSTAPSLDSVFPRAICNAFRTVRGRQPPVLTSFFTRVAAAQCWQQCLPSRQARNSPSYASALNAALCQPASARVASSYSRCPFCCRESPVDHV